MKAALCYLARLHKKKNAQNIGNVPTGVPHCPNAGKGAGSGGGSPTSCPK